MSTVLDASLAINICTRSGVIGLDHSAVALARTGLLAPPIFWHEVSSGLRNMMLQKKLSQPDRFSVLKTVRSLQIQVEPPTSDMESVITTSDRYQLSIYDAAYLELAVRTGSALATGDGGLKQKASRAGVALVTL